MNRLARGALSVLLVSTAVSSAAHPQSSNPANLPLRAGDRLLIKVWIDTTFADTVRIDESGAAVLPRLGPLVVAGLPSFEIADSVRRSYGRVIRTPAIEVTPLRHVTVLGEVKRPATYYVETHATMRDIVALAGGVTDIGALGHLNVIRGSERVVLSRWEERGDETVIARSGDVVIVDREPWLQRNVFSMISGLGVLFSLVYTVTR
jgi:protein involved in polysaccharide export with SLBB domain